MDVLIAIASGQIIFQDFKSRTGSIYILLVLLLLNAVIFYNSIVNYPVFRSLAFNTFILLVVIFSQFMLLYVKKRQFSNPLNKTIGTFDVLYLLLMAGCLSPKNYIYFIICSAVLGLIHGFMQLNSNKNKTVLIPFAAYMAITHILFIIAKQLSGSSLYNDGLFKNLYHQL